MKKTNKSINRQLFEAARWGSTEEINRCLSDADCDPLARDSYGKSALMLAAEEGSEACVRLLLPVSDPLARNGDGWTALMLAAKFGYEACVRMLLPVSDPLARDDGGRTALMFAARWGHEDCVKLLLPVSDFLAKDHGGRSAGQIAIERGYDVIAGMIEAYVLALNEATLLSTDTLPAPPRRAPVIRI